MYIYHLHYITLTMHINYILHIPHMTYVYDLFIILLETYTSIVLIVIDLNIC